MLYYFWITREHYSVGLLLFPIIKENYFGGKRTEYNFDIKEEKFNTYIMNFV